MICPNCGKPSTFSFHEKEWLETHGLDSGPYERGIDKWQECDLCGARTDDEEIAAANPTCPICDWPLRQSVDEGCVVGNCSYRPEQGSPEYHRIQQRKQRLAEEIGA